MVMIANVSLDAKMPARHYIYLRVSLFADARSY